MTGILYRLSSRLGILGSVECSEEFSLYIGVLHCTEDPSASPQDDGKREADLPYPVILSRMAVKNSGIFDKRGTNYRKDFALL